LDFQEVIATLDGGSEHNGGEESRELWKSFGGVVDVERKLA